MKSVIFLRNPTPYIGAEDFAVIIIIIIVVVVVVVAADA